jgi:hypothetical protein
VATARSGRYLREVFETVSYRHDKNIYDKVTHWFTVIGKELDDPAILPENVYNMDETGILFSVLSSLKVLVGKDDPRSYRGAGVKRTLVTAIECISADGRSLSTYHLARRNTSKHLDHSPYSWMALCLLQNWIHRLRN